MRDENEGPKAAEQSWLVRDAPTMTFETICCPLLARQDEHGTCAKMRQRKICRKTGASKTETKISRQLTAIVLCMPHFCKEKKPSAVAITVWEVKREGGRLTFVFRLSVIGCFPSDCPVVVRAHAN